MQTHTLPITAGQHRKILAVTKNREFRVFLEVLWVTGARPLEVARLSSDQVDLPGLRLRFNSLKWPSAPESGVGVVLNRRLLRIVRELPPAGPLFANLENVEMPALGRHFWLLRRKARVLVSVTIHSYRLRHLLKSGDRQ